MFGLFKRPQGAEISAQEVEARLKDRPFILDVREPSEYQQGHIPGVKLIPLGTLASRLQDLPKDQEIVVVCRSGARSGMATQQLRQAGFNAINMAGGMLGWRGPVER